MTFKSSKGWTWNGEMWEPPDQRENAPSATPVATAVVAATGATAKPKLDREMFAPPGGIATLSGFETLIAFGAPGQTPVVREIATEKAEVADAPSPAPLVIEAGAPAQTTVRLFTEKEDQPPPVTLIGLGINPALGRSASVFDHLSYEGRDWTEDEIDRVAQRSEKRSWERRRSDAPVWPRVVSSTLFIAGVALMLGNLTGTYATSQPLGFLVSALGLLLLHSKARQPIRLKHLSAIVAIMLAVTVFSGTRSYASNQSPAPAPYESPR